MLAPSDRNIFLSTLPASRADRRLALTVVGISIVLFVLAVPYAGVPLTPVPAFVASYQSALAVNDIITAILLYSQFGALRTRAPAAAGDRISLHCRRRCRARAVVPRPVCSGGIAGRRVPDHRLALHDLARRLPAPGAGLRAEQGPRWRSAGPAIHRQGHSFQRRGGRDRNDRLQLARHRTARRASDAAERRTLHRHHDRRGVHGVVLQPGGADRAVFSHAPFGDRRLADGRALCVAVRHRAVGDRQRGAVRPRLLCRADLRALRGEPRAGGAAGRQCRIAGADVAPGARAAPAVGARARPAYRARAAVQRGGGILQRRHHHARSRRHDHGLEQGGRTAVRIHGGRGGRSAYRSHHAVRSAERSERHPAIASGAAST